MAEFDDQPMDMKLQPGINIIKGPEWGGLKAENIEHVLSLLGPVWLENSEKEQKECCQESQRHHPASDRAA